MNFTKFSHFLPKSSKPIFTIVTQLPTPWTSFGCSMWPLHTSSVSPTYSHIHTHHQSASLLTQAQLPLNIHLVANQRSFFLLPLTLRGHDTDYNPLFPFFHNTHYTKQQKKQVPFPNRRQLL